ncbi:class V aminotransferase [Candidatus Nitrosoglobus terrae]|uniref:Class V aminotransferase n=1 Tax=Candidatus Nitrosoglobus terrae TaxID=1630141 RepID=A0A1Q2SMP2_9GAMM|nr:aminotransferase class V-fold PLP-dependent enzyme [Candidatus Nitrosoglobus terrae]BAW80406.1 class V aminotransferase [Candidatus Nitrosoglobus terrae]
MNKLSDQNNYHSKFPQKKGLIYLNHAGISPWPHQSADAVKRFADENTTIGAWHYSRWGIKEQQLRKLVCRLINAPSINDIALIKNTSEGLSIIAHGLDWRAGDNIVTSNQEFPSNLIPWQTLSELGVELRKANLMASITPEDSLMSLVDKRTRLLTISSVQYASGLKINLERLGQFCKERQILFCVDAIQSLGALNFNCQAINADFVVAGGHKWMLGPEGIGIFYSCSEAREKLQIHQFGWHMVEDSKNYEHQDWRIAQSARRFECGSLNMIGIIALRESLSLLLNEIGIAEVEKSVLTNTSYLIERIKAESKLQLLSSNAETQRSGIVIFKHHEVNQSALYQYLMDKRVICAYRGGGIRFSPHFYTSIKELNQALELVLKFSG